MLIATTLNAIDKNFLYSNLKILIIGIVIFFAILFSYFFFKRKCFRCEERILFNRYYKIEDKLICEKCRTKEKYEIVFSLNGKEIAYSLMDLEKKEKKEEFKKQFFDNYTNFIIKNQRQIFAFFIAIFLFSVVFISFLPKNYNAIYEKANTESENGNAILEKEFPYLAKENKVIIVLRAVDIKDNKTKNEVLKFTSIIEKRGKVYSIYSIYKESIANSLQKLNNYLFFKSEENNLTTIEDFENDLLRNNSVIFYLPSLFVDAWNALQISLEERNRISYDFAISQFKNLSYLSNEEKNYSLGKFNLFYEYWEETFNNSKLIKLTSFERANYCINRIYNSSFNIENWEDENAIHRFAITYYENKTSFSRYFIELAYSLGNNFSQREIKNLTKEIIEKNSIDNYPIQLKDIDKNFILEKNSMIILIEFSEKDSEKIKENIKFVKDNLKTFSSEVYLYGDYYTISENISAEENYLTTFALIIAISFLILFLAFRSVIIPMVLSAIALISFAIYLFLFYIFIKMQFNYLAMIGNFFLFAFIYFFAILFILKFKEYNLENALKTNGKTISLISLTLFIFFIPFYLSSFEEVKVVASSFLIAIFVAFICSILFLPSLVLLLKGGIFYLEEGRVNIKKLSSFFIKNSIIFIIILLLISSFAFYLIITKPIEKNSDEKIFVVIDGQILYDNSYNFALFKKIYDFTKETQKIKGVKEISSPIFQNKNINLKDKFQIEETINFFSKNKTSVIEIYLKENLTEEEKNEVILSIRENAKEMKLKANVYITGEIAIQEDNEDLMVNNLLFSFIFLILIFGILIFYFSSIGISLKLLFATFISSILSLFLSMYFASFSIIEFQIALITTFAIIFAFNLVLTEKTSIEISSSFYATFLIFAIVFVVMPSNNKIAISIATLFSFISYLFIMPSILNLRR